jgi:hypothetical protein
VSCCPLPLTHTTTITTTTINHSAEDEALVQQAVGFLTLDNVQKHKTGKKVGFLRDKAMGDALIREAFKAVGLEASFDAYMMDPYVILST